MNSISGESRPSQMHWPPTLLDIFLCSRIEIPIRSTSKNISDAKISTNQPNINKHDMILWIPCHVVVATEKSGSHMGKSIFVSTSQQNPGNHWWCKTSLTISRLKEPATYCDSRAKAHNWRKYVSFSFIQNHCLFIQINI